MQSNAKLLSGSSVMTQRYRETSLKKTKRRSGTSGELGVIYEKKILMLMLYRALKGGYNFTLDTNIEGAGALDDIVFTYKECNGIEQRIYLQAKHKEDERKRITYEDLMKPSNEDYALYGYFIDYLEIARNFKNIKNKYFIIYTNIDFHCPKPDDNRLRILKISDDDYFMFRKLDASNRRPLEVLSVQSNKAKKHPAFYQFDQNNEDEKYRVLNYLKSEFKSIDRGIKNPKLAKINEDELITKLEAYLNTLIFAVDQLDQEKLGKKIREEIEQNPLSTRSSDQVDFMLKYALNKIGQWKLRSEAKPLTEMDDYFNQAEKMFMKVPALYPTLVYENELAASNVRFVREKIIDLKNFISSRKQLWLISSKAWWLYSLVIYHALNEESLKEETSIDYADHDHHLFLTWSELLKGYKHILPAFEAMGQSLLIIASDIESTDSVNRPIVDEIAKIVSASESNIKQVIVILSESYDISKDLKQKLTTSYDQEYKIEFRDLSPESQETCLTRKNIRFQGKDELFSIQQLLGPEEQFSESVEIVTKFDLDISELEKLLKNPIVEIGNGQSKLSHLDSAHYRTYVHIQLEELKRAVNKCTHPSELTDDPGDIFAIAGEGNNVKSLLPSDSQQEFIRFKDGVSPVVNGGIILLKDGKEEEQFKQLCYEIDEVESSTALPALHLLKKDRKGWIWTRTYRRDFYMERYFYPVIVNKETIKYELLNKSPSIGFIVFSGTSEKELLELLKIVTDDEINIFRKNMAVFLEEVAAEEMFDRMGNDVKQSGKSVHWLKINKNQKQLQWYRTQGEVSRLRQVLVTEGAVRASLTEADLAKSTVRTIVLADEPGMGKTTTLARVAELMKKEKPQTWVMKIDLNRHQASLTTKQAKTIEDLLDLMSNIGENLDDSLARRILKYKLKCSGHVIFLWDGFDEVNAVRQDAILALFEFLRKETVASIWVTTRRQDQKKLEDCLSVLANPFEPIDKVRQINFLTHFWETTLKLTGNPDRYVLQSYAEKVIEGYERSVQSHEADKMISIPLWARLLAETYKKEVEKELTAKKPPSKFLKVGEHLNIGDLYEQFIAKKYDIYLREKGVIGEGLDEEKELIMRSYTEDYELLALKELFDRRKTEVFVRGKKIRYSFNKLSRIGLIQGNEEPVNFIHRTFAEYFAGKWLAENTQNSEVKKFLGIELFKKESGIVRRFFDHFLTEHLQLHRAVLEGDESALDESLLKNCDVDITDDLGRTALHLAAQAGRDGMIKYLRSTEADQLTRDQTGKTALHYAARFGYYTIVNKLLDRYRSIYKDIDLKDHIFRTPLHFDAEIGSSIFNKLEYARSKLVTLVNEEDEAGKTPLHFAADNGYWNTACSLLLYGADISVLTIEQNRKLLDFALEISITKCPGPIIGLLSIQVREALLEEIYYYEHFIEYFFHRGHTKVVDTLLRGIKNKERQPTILKRSHHYTRLLNSINNFICYCKWNVYKDTDFLKVVSYFYEQGAELGLKINKEVEGNFFNHAANHGFIETFRFLWENRVNKMYTFQHFQQEEIQERKKHIVCLISNIRDINDKNPWLRNLVCVTNKKFGWTRLHLAAMNKYVNVIEDFLNPSVYKNVNRKDANGFTPLIHAVDRGKSKFIENLFVALKVHNLTDRNQLYEIINARNNIDGRTPLHFAIRKGYFRSTKVLLKNIKNIDFNHDQLFNIVNSRDSYDKNPMGYIFSARGAGAIIKLFFKYIKSFNFSSEQYLEILKGSDGLLYKFIHFGRVRNVKFLFNAIEKLPLEESHRAEIFSEHNTRLRTLHVAAKLGDYKTIIVLLRKGAAFNAYNECQKTPLDVLNEAKGTSQNYEKTDFLLSSLNDLFALTSDEQIVHVPEKLNHLKETLEKLKKETWIDPDSILKARNRENETLLRLSKHQRVTDFLRSLKRGCWIMRRHKSEQINKKRNLDLKAYFTDP